jgi:FkbM family methyltransferase
MKTFVELGVCDFSTLEPLLDNGWEGYFVEPIERYAKKLEGKNITQAAISSYNGELKMYQSKEYTENNLTWVNGISHAVEQQGEKLLELPENEHLIENTITVPCYTLQTYLKINNITSIDYLKVDVEGHETDIFEAYDWSVLPTYIKMEHVHIDDIKMKDILEEQGYIVSLERRDLYAIR